LIFAPNHSSNLDTVAVIAALPRRFRRRLAPAVSQDYFLPYLAGTGSLRERISLAVQFWLAVLILNVFPLPQATRGVRGALQFAGQLVDGGYSILIYPEGARTPDGRMRAFRPGVGVLAVRLGIPVVPVHIQGLFEVLPVDASWPAPGPVRLRFGAPIRFREGEDFRTAARKVEEEVRRLAAPLP
jgi:long-chain acyl-CoA synthetase